MIKRFRENDETEVQSHRTSQKRASCEGYQWKNQSFILFLIKLSDGGLCILRDFLMRNLSTLTESC